MEIKKKLTVTRGEWGGGQWGKKGKSQGICIKDPWTKTMVGGGWVGLNVEDGGMGGQGRLMGEK